MSQHLKLYINCIVVNYTKLNAEVPILHCNKCWEKDRFFSHYFLQCGYPSKFNVFLYCKAKKLYLVPVILILNKIDYAIFFKIEKRKKSRNSTNLLGNPHLLYFIYVMRLNDENQYLFCLNHCPAVKMVTRSP